MEHLTEGFERAIQDVIYGIIGSVLVNSLLVSLSYEWIINLINALATISLVEAMRYWGKIYLLGWIIGMVIMFQAGILDRFDIFAILMGIYLLVRGLTKLTSKS
ncbi:MAG: hypothetical protein ACPLSM_06810 [Thermosphaera sp.]